MTDLSAVGSRVRFDPSGVGGCGYAETYNLT